MTQAQGNITRRSQFPQLHAAALYLYALLFAVLSVAPAGPLLDSGMAAGVRAGAPALDHTLRSENLSLAARVSPDEHSGAPSSSAPHVALAASGFAIAVALGLQSTARTSSGTLLHKARSAHRSRAPPSALLT